MYSSLVSIKEKVYMEIEILKAVHLDLSLKLFQKHKFFFPRGNPKLSIWLPLKKQLGCPQP